jgi:hypothetical protein
MALREILDTPIGAPAWIRRDLALSFWLRGTT